MVVARLHGKVILSFVKGGRPAHTALSGNIESLIRTIRGQKVILDADLARLYGVETKAFNRAVKRNSGRFPQDFMFQLTREEFDNLKYHFGTSSSGHGGRRKLPLAFTENGAVMSANVLNSPQAVRMSVFVVRAFVKMREMLAGTKELAGQLKALEAALTARLDMHEAAIVDVLQRIMRLLDPPPEPDLPRRPIGCHTPPEDDCGVAGRGETVKLKRKVETTDGQKEHRYFGRNWGRFRLTEGNEENEALVFSVAFWALLRSLFFPVRSRKKRAGLHGVWNFEFSIFGFVSDFEIRISDFSRG